MTKTGAGENRKTIETEILSNKYMTNKLKMLSMAALATVAAVTSSQAATPTNVTVVSKISVTLTAYPVDTLVTNKTGTVITATDKASAFTTKTLLASIATASGIAIANTNTAALAWTNALVLTNGYLVAYTNSGKGTFLTNFFTGTNYAGLTNIAGVNVNQGVVGLTIATNLIYVSVASGYATVIGKAISIVSNVNFSAFPIGGYGGFTGSSKALDGVSIPSATSGSYAISEASLSLNSPSNTWTLAVSGNGGTGSRSVQNLGTAKAPAYLETSDTSVPVVGQGMAVSATSTNYYDFKGTVTESFWYPLK